MESSIGVIDFPTVITKFDKLLELGLCSGVGDPEGMMCIEAAIACAMDLPFGDDPVCVAPAIRTYKIGINDAYGWGSTLSRAKGLRDIGIAQIGSRGVVDEVEFAKRIAEKTIRVLIPKLFRQVFAGNPELLALADRCEAEGTEDAARDAASAARATASATASATARAASYAASYAASAASDAASYAASYAASAASDASSDAASDASSYAARDAASDASSYAARDASSYAASDAARYAASDAARYAASEPYLVLAAQLCLEVLQELNSPGCAWINYGKPTTNETTLP